MSTSDVGPCGGLALIFDEVGTKIAKPKKLRTEPMVNLKHLLGGTLR